MSNDNLITFFVPSLQGGGAERVIVELANAFHDKGRKVELVVCDNSGPYKKELNPNIPIVDLLFKRVIFCFIPLVLYLIKNKPFALYSTMMHANIAAIAAKRLSFSACRVVVREAVTTEKTNGRPVKDGKNIILTLASKVYPSAYAIVGVSKGVLNSLIRDLDLSETTQMNVIYNPVISHRFYGKSNEPTPLLDFKRQGAVLLIAVARLADSKDYPTMLKAFARIRQELDAQLLILGEGVARAELEELIASLGIRQDVHMPGFVDNPFPYIKAADMFVHSSIYEGMPNSVIQALALQKRAVVTLTKDGPAELFDGVASVRLVPTGDSTAFANAVLEMLKLDEIQPPSNEWFEMFSSKGIVEQYESYVA